VCSALCSHFDINVFLWVWQMKKLFFLAGKLCGFCCAE
jgi:hypothetical protein